MINNILQLLQDAQNPGMQLASAVPQSYQDDIGAQSMDLNAVLARLSPQEEVSFGNPRTISGQVQEWLGAKPPTQGGLDQQILSQRLQPSSGDAINAITQTWADPTKAATSQQFADERMNLAQKMQLMGQRSQGNSVFSSTMEMINSDPELANLPMIDKIRLAQKGISQNMTYGPNGVIDMAGAAQGLGNLSYGDQSGTNRANIEGARPLAVQRGLGEADTASLIAQNSAVGKATGEAVGGLAKKTVNAPQILTLIQQAKSILPHATGGGLQSQVAGGKAYLGVSDQATQADAQLDVISAGLLNNVPRMEGPQSDADRISYEKAAGDVGNRKLPTGNRLAALSIIEEIQNRYLNNPQGTASQGGDLSGYTTEQLQQMLNAQ